MVFAPGLKRAETADEMIERLSKPDTVTDCWIWGGSFNEKGYPKIHPRGGTKGMSSRVPRVIYELKNGPIPEGLEIDHTCQNRWCVNPDHLEAVTHQENIQRQRAHRIATVFTCEHGHTLRVRKNGTRFCYECKAEYQRQYRLGIRVRSSSNGPE